MHATIETKHAALATRFKQEVTADTVKLTFPDASGLTVLIRRADLESWLATMDGKSTSEFIGAVRSLMDNERR